MKTLTGSQCDSCIVMFIKLKIKSIKLQHQVKESSQYNEFMKNIIEEKFRKK